MDYLLIFLGVMIFLFAVGVPVAISIGLTCLVVLVAQGGIDQIPEELFAMQMLSGMNNFPIIAVPFFILAASLMNTGSSNERIFNFATALVGPIRGGLGHVNVLASVIFAGMSATAVADVAGIGQLELKAMKERGYPERFSVGITGLRRSSAQSSRLRSRWWFMAGCRAHRLRRCSWRVWCRASFLRSGCR